MRKIPDQTNSPQQSVKSKKEIKLTRLEKSIWLIFKQVCVDITNYEEHFSGRHTITPQQSLVLQAIRNLKSPVSQQSVAKKIKRHPYSVSMIIDRMERDGWVKRIPNPNDRRASSLVITQKGKDALKEASKLAPVMQQKLLAAVSPENLVLFKEMLLAIRNKARDLEKRKEYE